MKSSNANRMGASGPLFKLNYYDDLAIALDSNEFQRIQDITAEDRTVTNLGATTAPKFRPAGFRGYLEIIEERE